MFLGYQAGYTETGSNTLYIANSDTSSPLIYGEFGTGEVTINGNSTVTGTVTSASSTSWGTETSTNTTNIATHYGLIGVNTTNMTAHQAALGVHTTQIAGNAANIATNAGEIAGAMAMAQLSEAGPGEKLVVSLGGGNWEGSTAMAAGLSGRLNETFSLRGSASLGSGNAGVGASVGWRFK